MQENRIDAETAGLEFDRFATEMDLDLDISYMAEDDLVQFSKQKRRIVGAIQVGDLVINDNGEASYTPRHPRSKHKEAITFRERTGASLIATDKKGKNHDAAKTYAMMGDICGVSPAVFSGLVGKDIKICEAIFALLMD